MSVGATPHRPPFTQRFLGNTLNHFGKLRIRDGGCA